MTCINAHCTGHLAMCHIALTYVDNLVTRLLTNMHLYVHVAKSINVHGTLRLNFAMVLPME